MCGGTAEADLTKVAPQGLSPRVRGNPGVSVSISMMLRSIPACAGEPMESSNERTIQKVYPRVCGGTVISTISRMRFFGLSPRVRGNLPCTEIFLIS